MKTIAEINGILAGFDMIAVPIEPTPPMIEAARKIIDNEEKIKEIYAEMLWSWNATELDETP